ncbi:MAG: DUF167 domain-containing protein [Rickettsiaceae bacterium]|nr:DUF167 domain-containing protein [Rickettsiaceae bacterium]
MKVIEVRLTPNSSSNRIGEIRKMLDGVEQLMVYVTPAPENGKANAAMIRLLAKYYNLAPSRFSILKGATNRNKLIGIEE